jgi:hypothetical protein
VVAVRLESPASSASSPNIDPPDTTLTIVPMSFPFPMVATVARSSATGVRGVARGGVARGDVAVTARLEAGVGGADARSPRGDDAGVAPPA